MTYNKENLLEQVSNLLAWKKSKQFMADKLNISIEELNELLIELRSIEKVSEAADQVESYLKSTEEYVVKQGWIKEKGLSINFAQKKMDKEEQMKSFADFLDSYKPAAIPVENKYKHEHQLANACLVVNKQDAHLNKFDIDGSNNINARFTGFMKNLGKILRKSVATANLNRIVYAIGSDEFNSEWTSRTTHDTPQQNILSYHEGFEAICNHEISVINMLQEYSDNVHVIYVPGNHDEFVAWHMIMWLKTYFRNCPNVHFDVRPSYTKYIKFSNSAMCFNHGYIVKPEQLAQNFPIEFKEHWSSCDHFYIFTGDKHTELSRTIGGIKFYRIAQISKAKSKWDSEKGYVLSKGEITAFLIEEEEGLTDIYHQTIG